MRSKKVDRMHSFALKEAEAQKRQVATLAAIGKLEVTLLIREKQLAARVGNDGTLAKAGYICSVIRDSNDPGNDVVRHTVVVGEAEGSGGAKEFIMSNSPLRHSR